MRVEFPFEWHEEVLKWIADSKGGEGSAGVIPTHLNLIDDFIHTVAMPAFELKTRFEEMKKKYPVRQKSTPADASEAAVAKRIRWLKKHKDHLTKGS